MKGEKDSNVINDSGPLSLCQVLEEEYVALHGLLPDTYPRSSPHGTRLSAIYALIHALPTKRTALCLSGGGIRSATIGLGVLQGLARFKDLGQFDYLSTVSGGGYIGGWLTAWIHRHPEGVTGVAHALRHEPMPVTWLRAYSNYLSPRLGLFSPDTWVLIYTYLYNLAINWFMLIPLIVAGLALPRLYIALVQVAGTVALAKACGIVGSFSLFLALTYLNLYRPSLESYRLNRAWKIFEEEGYFVLLFLTSAVLLTASWAWFTNANGTLQVVDFHGISSPWLFGLGGGLIHLLSSLFSVLLLRRRFTLFVLGEIGRVIIWGALGGYLFWWAVMALPSNPIKDYAEWYACLAPPVYLTLLFLLITAGRSRSIGDQMWLDRAGGLVLMIAIIWGVLSGIVIVSSVLLVLALEKLGALITYLGGAIGTLATLFSAFSSKTRATTSREMDKQTLVTDFAVRYLAAPVFILFVMALISIGTSFLLKWYAISVWSLHGIWNGKGLLMPNDTLGHLPIIHNTPLWVIVHLVLLMVLTVLAVGFFLLDINKFSLHRIYRDRLVRAYLGASRGEVNGWHRQPYHIRAFDPGDNLSMHHLGLTSSARPSIQRPFHIVNIALNLVSGRNLAWQQRKAQSFTVSPLHCGSYSNYLGYRRSSEYGRNQATDTPISLGTALAISGAAASPNMGYHSSPAVTFLMTLFNIRLGWWLGNPGMAGENTFGRSGPEFAVGPMVAEAFGLTNEQSRYVYLSDGGHFENLGLYEMVLRRCHYIVAIDAGCDPVHSFEDLGNAIRKIRIDLGIAIELDVESLRLIEKTHLTREHYVIGLIRYSIVDGNAPDGILVYVKPSLTGDEPVDVTQYAGNHEVFPHEPTLDQFFDESQFESYRLLGEHIASQVFQKEPLCSLEISRGSALPSGQDKAD